MEQNRTSVWKATLNTGIFLGLVLVLYSLLLYFTNQITNRNLGYISLVIDIVGLCLGINSFRKNYRDGFLSYGQVLGAGVVISLYAAIISGIFVYVLYAYIDQDLIRQLLDISRDKMMEKGMNDQQIEMSMKITSKIMKPWFMGISSVLNGVFFGTLISLILGIFLKREGEAPFAEATTEEGE
ncbi:MAG TPA: DUF4199 domain-containing protein [Bacteroidetes bacterium]|nr:DUF4199 domain-containing protein [Bacteroidota bacterium]